MSQSKPLQSIGPLVAKKRNGVPLRVTAKEIGISAATLLRVEQGQLPDLANFKKVCSWLEVDESTFLGSPNQTSSNASLLTVHFRKKSTVEPATAQALADLILAAQRAMASQE